MIVIGHMKTFIFESILFSSLLMFSSYQEAVKNLSLQEALKNKHISIQVEYVDGAPHYKYPLSVQIENLQSTPLLVDIKSGHIFQPDDDQLQDMIVTEDQPVALQPREKKTLILAAMCISPSKGSGYKGTSYRLSEESDPALQQLATFIGKSKIQTSEAQQALWVLVNNQPLSCIYGPDTVLSLGLQQQVAAIRKEQIPEKLLVSNSYQYNYYYGELKIELSGYFNYDIHKARNMEIAMFNERGVLVRELMRKQVSSAGKHRFDYKFDASVYDEDVYYVKLIMDDRIIVSRKVPLGEVRKNWR
jgi:hypothetical protein